MAHFLVFFLWKRPSDVPSAVIVSMFPYLSIRAIPVTYKNSWFNGFSLHTFASYVLSGNTLYTVFSFIYNWSTFNTTHCNDSVKNTLYMCIIIHYGKTVWHQAFFVKKSCQTDFNSNIQPLESEAAGKKDKKSDLTESMGKYIFFLYLMVKRVVYYERRTLVQYES